MYARDQRVIARRIVGAPARTPAQRLTRLIVGAVVVVIGLMALTQTVRFLPWMFLHAGWPLIVAGAGLLLLLFGGRGSLGFGLALLALGGLFLIGSLISVTWLLMAAFWPLILIVVGGAIFSAGLLRDE